MYYAVISDGELCFLSEDRNLAIDAIGKNPGSTLSCVATLEGLKVALAHSATFEEPTSNDPSDAMKSLLSKLDDWGLDKDLMDDIKSGSEELLDKAKSLGAKGMQTVGDSLIALGEMIRQAKPEVQKNDEPKCCGGRHCHE